MESTTGRIPTGQGIYLKPHEVGELLWLLNTLMDFGEQDAAYLYSWTWKDVKAVYERYEPRFRERSYEVEP